MNSSIAHCWALAIFRFFDLTHSRQDSLDGESVRRQVPTYTIVYASSGIRTHDVSVRVGEDNSYLRSRGHCDRF
jgi:hypothetical protein